jgi:transposase
MIPIPQGSRVWLATGHTDMRKGFDGLALIVQETLKRDPHCGHLFVFRGRRGDPIKCSAAATILRAAANVSTFFSVSCALALCVVTAKAPSARPNAMEIRMIALF